MAITANPVSRDVLKQIVKDPRYKEVTHVPVLAFQQWSLAIGSLSVFALASAAYLAGFLPLWIAMLANLAAVYVAFTPLHDASHRAVSRNDTVNDLLGTITGQLLLPGINMTAFRAIHMDHHRFVGEEGRDPDTGFVDPPKWMGLPYLMFADLHWVAWYYKYGRHIWSRKVGIALHTTLALVIISHAAFLMSPWWKEFLLLYIVPQRLGLGIVAYTFAHIQHPSGLTWKDQPFQSTVYVRGKSALRRLMFGQEEHIIHHLVPHVPWYKYRRVWDLANNILSKQGIPSRGWFEGPRPIDLSSSEQSAPISMQVAAIQDEARNIRTLTLKPVENKLLPASEPGAHIELYLPGGLVRQYSLVTHDDSVNIWQIAVKREDNGRGGSLAVHALRAGDIVDVARPRNNFMLYENAPAFRLIVGGIGLTALLPMARRLQKLGKNYTLHTCVQDEGSLPFAEELLGGAIARNCNIHFDTADGSSSLNPQNALASPAMGELLYLCGPSGFMDWLRTEALGLGWPEDAIHVESFSADLGTDAENHPFTLKLAKTKREIEVPADKSILDSLSLAGIDTRYACMQGTCGRCAAPVLEGQVEHRDAYFSKEEKAENKKLCLCVSRAKERVLTLDL